MQEKTILKISAVLVLFGLTFLFFYSSELNFKVVQDFDNLVLEEEVKLTGKVNRVSQSEKVTFLELSAQTTNTLDVIVFNHENIFVQEGDYVELTGTVEEYQGKYEIIANQIVIK